MILRITKGRSASFSKLRLTDWQRSVYVELADQYKDMDPVSDVPKRNMLAQHLREVVDILEQKAGEIPKNFFFTS
jgi:ferric iron reductase protein FhuF